MGNLSLGFLLMAVGMVTVFIILIIVIYGSQFMIFIMNKLAPAQDVASGHSDSSDIKAVLDAAVAQLTSGRGHIINVTKLN